LSTRKRTGSRILAWMPPTIPLRSGLLRLVCGIRK
jgi:hypothetical protein